MFQLSLLTGRKAQSILEYTIVLGVIVLVVFAMGPMLKRGTQSLIKVVADQVGVQKNAEQFGLLLNETQELGYLEASYTSARGAVDKQTFDVVGMTNYVYNDVTTTQTNTRVNLGFTEE